MLERSYGRKTNELRPLRMTMPYLNHAPGSVLVEFGNTKVLCVASIDDKTAPFLKNTGKGWLTAEYAMLPMSTQTRSQRESARGKIGGRTHEIQRLVGRSLRAVTDLAALGERTVYIDCDVIQADGGTRTASITGAFVALVGLLRDLKNKQLIESLPVIDSVSAVSVGLMDDIILLDLDYAEDSRVDVDMNFVRTGSGLFVEVQGTAEHRPFTKRQMMDMTEMASSGIDRITACQLDVLGDWRT
ncbi:MAG TPA: ribonuclease PH [Smithellaceae bacterium]|nr:ribonuclease PH [Smithellaceae bacterium]